MSHKKEAGLTYRSISHERAMWRMIRIVVIGRIKLESDTNSKSAMLHLDSIEILTLHTLRIHCCQGHRLSLSRRRMIHVFD